MCQLRTPIFISFRWTRDVDNRAVIRTTSRSLLSVRPVSVSINSKISETCPIDTVVIWSDPVLEPRSDVHIHMPSRKRIVRQTTQQHPAARPARVRSGRYRLLPNLHSSHSASGVRSITHRTLDEVGGSFLGEKPERTWDLAQFGIKLGGGGADNLALVLHLSSCFAPAISLR